MVAVERPLLALDAAAGVFRSRRGTLTPPTAQWTPIYLLAQTPPPRPARGPGVVYWEDIYVSGDTPQQTLNRVPLDGSGNKQMLGLPSDIIEFPAWTNGSGATNGMAIGTNGAGGISGLWGTDFNTVIRPKTNATRPSSGVLSTFAGAQMLRVQGVPNFFMSTIQFRRTPQLQPYNAGFMLDTCDNAIVQWIRGRGVNPGYDNTPPGETFFGNIFGSDNVIVRDFEADGRDEAGNRVCASPLGWNGKGSYGTHGSGINFAQNAQVQRAYLHHGLTSGLTFWYTQKITTYDVWSYSTMSGTGANAFSCINHEQDKGPILHVRPGLFIHGPRSGTLIPAGIPGEGGNEPVTTAGGSWHWTLRSTIEDLGASTTILEPRWDAAYTSGTGTLIYLGSAGYTFSDPSDTTTYTNGDVNMLSQTPHVEKNGIVFTERMHPLSGWQNGDPTREMARVT